MTKVCPYASSLLFKASPPPLPPLPLPALPLPLPLPTRRPSPPQLSLRPDLSRSADPTQLTLLLDCDNTLVLSEHLAFAGCASLINQILANHSVPKTFTGPELQQYFVGQNFRGMLTSLMKEYDLSIPQDQVEVLVKAEEEAVIAHLRPPELQPCVGVIPALDAVTASHSFAPDDLTLAVVSSSALRRVNVSLENTGLAKYFGPRVFSAATSLPVPTSKPDPAVYLFAMDKLGAKPEECVAVEDSKSGTTSAVRAGIRTIGYVGPYEGEEREKMRGVLREAGAGVVMEDWSEFGKCLEEIAKL